MTRASQRRIFLAVTLSHRYHLSVIRVCLSVSVSVSAGVRVYVAASGEEPEEVMRRCFGGVVGQPGEGGELTTVFANDAVLFSNSRWRCCV